MFSTMPATGIRTFSLRNISTPRATSATATCWGVETITAASIFSSPMIDRCTSPVPGGRSASRKSSVPQRVWWIICLRALTAIAPRHSSASVGLMKKPIDMSLMSIASAGRMRSVPSSCTASGM